MGYLYEELIRRFSELSNETAGERFTPREVIKLMVNLLFTDDDDLLQKPGVKATLFDPACGTGGMLSVAENFESLSASTIRQRERMLQNGELGEHDGRSFRLLEDALFKSPSAAAAILLARNANGRVEWNDTHEVTLKQRQLEQSDLAVS